MEMTPTLKLWNHKDKDFFAPLVKIGLPIMLGQLISYSLNLIDSIMIGRVGEMEYSAVALANQPFFIVFICISGIGGGMGILISQYFGRGGKDAFPSIFGSALCAGLLLTGLATVLVQFMPQTVMSIYTPDVALQEIGMRYIKIVSLSYMLSGFSNLVYMACRNVGNVKFGLFSSIFAIAINTTLNYGLIFGKLGLPEMGVEGAAIATVTARVAEVLVCAIYLFTREKVLQIRLPKLFHIRKDLAADYIRYGIPVFINDAGWSILASTHLMIAGRMGSSSVAAWAINSAVQEMTFVAIIAFSTAASILISKTVGGGDYVRAGNFTISALKIAFCIGVVGGCILMFAAPKIALLYNVSPEALANAMTIFKILPFVFFVKSMACMIIIGILRGSGDTKTAAIFDITPMFITVPLGYLVGVVLKQPIWMVYMVLMSDELMKVVLGLMRINKGNFIRNLTRD